MKILATILVLAILLLESAACTSQPSTPAITLSSTPTITFEDDRCEYSGPDSIPADQFTFQWVVNSQQYEENLVRTIQMEEGHQVEDLIGVVVKAPAPAWISVLRYEKGTQPGPWTKEVSWDLTQSGRLEPTPVYFLCTHVINGEEIIYGVAGPVDINE